MLAPAIAAATAVLILSQVLSGFAGPRVDVGGSPRIQPGHAQQPIRPPDVPYVPTPPEVVSAMLELARVDSDDVVYDLGSGDGRILIAAAQRYGARGVGIDIDPARIREAAENARAGGVAHLVSFVEQDLFEADISDATVVMLYLLPSINYSLRPKLLRELRPAARIVSHAFGMGDWAPVETRHVAGRTIHLWVVPYGDR
jgi:SAM-dependent methyltransferase